VAWVFCDSAPPGGLPLQWEIDGPVSVLATDNARQETDPSYLWSNFMASTLVTGANPRAGSQQASIKISAGSGEVSLPVSIVYTLKPFVYVADTSLGFSTSPYNLQDQAVTLWFPNATSPIAFTASIENAPWLSVTPSSGSGYTELKAHVDSTSLAPGSYFGSIVITAPAAINSPLKIPVRMLIAQPRFVTFPTTMTFTQVSGGVAPAAQSLAIRAADTQMGLPFTASSDSPWLSVSPASGVAALQATLSVSVKGSGLAAGIYHGNVTLNALGAIPAQVPVTFTVTSANSLTLSPNTFSFYYWPGISETFPAGTLFDRGTINITSNIPARWQASKSSGTDWLGMSFPDNGTTPGAYTFFLYFPSVPGNYSGSIAISSTQAGNSPQSAAITLNVLAAAPVDRNPTRLSFQSKAGAAPPSQSVTVTAAAATSFTTSISSGNNWLSVAPGSGTTPATLTVSARPSGFVPGSYSGVVTLAVVQPDGSTIPVGIPVTLSISP
jgi:hypothetical protein